MSLLYTIQDAENKVVLLCPSCKKPVGSFDPMEWSELLMRDIKPLCFDCDPDNPDIVPHQLVEFDYRWFLHLGDKIFVADWDCNVRDFKQQNIYLQHISLLNYFFLKTGWRDAMSPLSSTLNLHKTPMQKASLLVVDGELS